MSQSSNDTFPTALHIAAAMSIEDNLFPAMDKLTETLKRLESENEDVVKSGRTHLQDAVPIRFSQEISGWRNMLEKTKKMLEASLPGLKELALGGTAVGDVYKRQALSSSRCIPLLILSKKLSVT